MVETQNFKKPGYRCDGPEERDLREGVKEEVGYSYAPTSKNGL